MTPRTLTPAQAYAARIVEAIDGLLCDPENMDAADSVLMMILERPRTLRCALAAYLHKSRMQSMSRK